jgi:hypothetical protein
VRAADISVRQIVTFLVGGLMVAAGAYTTARAGAHFAAANVVFLGVIAIGSGFVVAGVVQWHRKVYC